MKNNSYDNNRLAPRSHPVDMPQPGLSSFPALTLLALAASMARVGICAVQSTFTGGLSFCVFFDVSLQYTLCYSIDPSDFSFSRRGRAHRSSMSQVATTPGIQATTNQLLAH